MWTINNYIRANAKYTADVVYLCDKLARVAVRVLHKLNRLLIYKFQIIIIIIIIIIIQFYNNDNHSTI